ncbi:hypothetical protein ACIQ7Q_24970 [Streptomyces sp. NPDC096176]|uniref:hypothetical protein n=1 Tax=Streptomyces sp. NPDC096176 TaxID=3366079 RepID=UPI00380F4295
MPDVAPAQAAAGRSRNSCGPLGRTSLRHPPPPARTFADTVARSCTYDSSADGVDHSGTGIRDRTSCRDTVTVADTTAAPADSASKDERPNKP